METRSSNKIRNMAELRDYALETLQLLKERKIELSEAIGVAKICDSVVNTANAEMKYAAAISQTPQIDFFGDQKVLEHK